MPVIRLDSIGSTSEYLKQDWQDFEDMTFVVADSQSSGHGRYDRVWESQPGKNLLFSLIIKNPLLLNKAQRLSALTAVCIRRCLTYFGIKHVSIKWPNDIYIKDKKVCGILLESQLPNYVIIGVGINVNQRKFECPTATSVCKHRILPTDLALFTDIVLRQLESDLIILQYRDNSIEDYRANNYLKGKDIEYEINNQKHFGKVLDINENNELIVINELGVSALNSGEVKLIHK